MDGREERMREILRKHREQFEDPFYKGIPDASPVQLGFRQAWHNAASGLYKKTAPLSPEEHTKFLNRYSRIYDEFSKAARNYKELRKDGLSQVFAKILHMTDDSLLDSSIRKGFSSVEGDFKFEGGFVVLKKG